MGRATAYPRRTHGQGDHVPQAEGRDAGGGVPELLADAPPRGGDPAPGCAPLRPVPRPSRPSYGHDEPIYDGIAEVWADDTDALRAMTRSPAHAALQADEARFIDRASMGVIITEDHVIKDGPVPPDAVKSVAFLTRKAGPVRRGVPAALARGARAHRRGAARPQALRPEPHAPLRVRRGPRPRLRRRGRSPGSTRRTRSAARQPPPNTRACSPTPGTSWSPARHRPSSPASTSSSRSAGCPPLRRVAGSRSPDRWSCTLCAEARI